MLKFLIFIPFFLIKVSTSGEIFSQIKIYYQRADLDTVDFGMRGTDNDVISRTFIIENNSPNTVWNGEGLTFITNESNTITPNNTHPHFQEATGTNNIAIPPGGQIIRTVEFYPNSTVLKTIGLMEARLQLGVSSKEDVVDIIYKREFLLQGRASPADIDLWENDFIWDKKIAFDSVLIGDGIGVETDLNIRNNSDGKLTVSSGELKFITSELVSGEITINLLGKEFPFDLAPKTDPLTNDEKFVITYLPKDRGPDSALYIIKFINQEGGESEVSATISGTGVNHSLDLYAGSHDFENTGNWYIIDIGDIALGENENVRAFVENDGNMRVGIKGITLNTDNCTVNVIENIAEIGESINLFQGVELSLDIEATESGLFWAEYIIETDLLERNIAGVSNQDQAYFKFRIRGRAIAPKINIWTDSLDFGNIPISANANCPSYSEKELIVKNIGNDDLIINYVETTKPSVFSSSIDEGEKLIKAGDTISITVAFHPSDKSTFTDSLIINYSGFGQDNKNGFVYLSGGGIDPSSSVIKIMNQSYKPGTEIFVPIIVSGQQVSLAAAFTSTVSFNPTMLSYRSYISQGTAAQGANLFSSIIAGDDSGVLEIDLQMPGPETFNPSDTLLILAFDSFLGNSKRTLLSFSNPRFFDDNCDDLLDIEFNNSGYISIDSLCGLENLIQFYNGLVEVGVAEKPLLGKIEFSISSKNIDELIHFRMYNIFGDTMLSKTFIGQGNEIVFSIDKDNFLSGQYFAHFTIGSQVISKKLLIIN